MAMPTFPLLAAALLFLAPGRALAARYDPDADRSALRQAATLANSTVVDATARPLEPEQAPAISAGLDEGLRQAGLAADAARSLDAAAGRRAAVMEAGVKESALDRDLRELRDPVAAERRRWEKLSAERDALKAKVDALPEEERQKLRPLLARASGGLRAAAEALGPLEDSLAEMTARSLDMKERRLDSLAPLVEISSAAAGAIARAGELSPAAVEAKARLGALGQEPRAAARTRAWEKLELLRGLTRLLFQDADRACNRADEFRRHSSAYEEAAGAYDKARRAAAAGPAAAKSSLDETRKALDVLAERLKKP